MKHLVLSIAVVVVGIVFCAPANAQGKPAGTAKPTAAQSGKATPEEGQKVFQREKCGMCHTATRNSLAGVGAKLNDAQIREWIHNPVVAAQKAKSTAKPPMRSYAKLSESDVDALVAYLKSLK